MNISKILDTLNPLEREQVFSILQDMKRGSTKTISEFISNIWDEIPVDLDIFIDDKQYMGNYFYPDGSTECILYPYWRDRLKEIFKDPYQFSEIAFTGGIGLGKSEAAKLGLVYLSYRIMCLKNPQLFYNKPLGKPIVILFFNNTVTLAEKVLLQPFVDTLQTSPWFKKHGRFTGTEHIRYKPFKNIRFEAGSQATHALGQDIIGGIIDELNFAPGQNVSLEKTKIMETYNALNTRITNRFRVEGKVHGKLFMVSSKKSEYDFLEQYAQKMKDEENFYIVDDKVWNIVPQKKSGYTGVFFKLAIGGNRLPSKIIQKDESIDDYIKQGYDIMDIPIEEKQKFELNMERSLMDIAAISVSYVTKFLNYDMISQNYTEDKNPFTQEILSIGTTDDMQIKDFFKLDLISPDIKKKHLFVYIDGSLTGDRTGISGVCLLGKSKMKSFDVQANKTITSYQVLYKHVFTIEIQCPKNAQISFQKTRDFITYLDQIGFNICGIGSDGWNSADTIQLLQSYGFKNVKRINFESTPEIYLGFRNALIEKKLSLLHIDVLEKELLQVERNNMSGKIEHPRSDITGHGDGCLSFDTEIFLLSGKKITIEELYDNYENEWVLACDTISQKLTIVKINKVIRKHIPDKLIKITLDNNKSFSVTEDHLILCKDNIFREAGNLTIGQSLMPFNNDLEKVGNSYYPRIIDPYKHERTRLHKLVVIELNPNAYTDYILPENNKFHVVHHIDHIKTNNNPNNLKIMGNVEHNLLHETNNWTHYNKSEKHRRRVSELNKLGKSGWQKLDKENPERMRQIRSENRKKQAAKWNGTQRQRDWLNSDEGKKAMKKANDASKIITQSKAFSDKCSIASKERYKNKEYKQFMIDNASWKKYNSRPDMKEKQKIGKIKKTYKLMLDNNLLNKEFNLSDFKIAFRKLKDLNIISKYNGCPINEYDLLIKAGVPLHNHKITNIETIKNYKHVYDIQLSQHHNFALNCGVFVHNCDSLSGAYYIATLLADEYTNTLTELFTLGQYEDTNELNDIIQQLSTRNEFEQELMNTKLSPEQIQIEKENKPSGISNWFL